MTSQTIWKGAGPVGGVAVLAVLVWRLGTGPFLDGLRRIDGPSLVLAAAIAGLTTVSCAWRWRLVARGLGVDLPLSTAVAAYYRSVFLNTTLPGGVLGDVHRGVRHGRDVGDVSRGLRAVVWERTAGQVVQAVLTITVLLALPSPVRSSVPVVAAAVVGVGLGALLLSRALPQGRPSRWAGTLRAAGTDVRDGLLARRAWPGIVLASAFVVTGHTATFLIAARTAGSTESAARMLPLALLVLLAMVLPSFGGWGPREGGAAWMFGAAGVGAAQGVATAVTYGVLVFVASLPGAVVLVLAWLHRDTFGPDPTEPPRWTSPVMATRDGAVHG
ncbi:MAG: flippase-like domain-containing protein [Actinomycetota bacterium]|nr:flippase-like domain-containing protein [Actinomycetota bacterium]